MNYVLAEFHRMPWALEPGKYLALQEMLDRWMANGPRPEGFQAATRPTTAVATGGIAVLPIYGVLTKRANMLTDMSGASSADQIGAEVDRLVADPSVRGIVLDVDSPGGNVYGIPELAGRIQRARAVKPVVAIANAMAASAAYWIASAATEVMVTPSGQVGAIGIITSHLDESGAMTQAGLKRTIITSGKYKGEGSMGSPLTDEEVAYIQSLSDDYYGQFVKAVAKGRGVGVDAVRDGFGEGRIVNARAALDLKMVDHLGELGDAIALARKLAAVGVDRDRRLALVSRS